MRTLQTSGLYICVLLKHSSSQFSAYLLDIVNMALLELVALLQTPFAIVGVFIVLRYLLTNIWDLIENIYAFYISEGLGRTVKYKELGEWAGIED